MSELAAVRETLRWVQRLTPFLDKCGAGQIGLESVDRLLGFEMQRLVARQDGRWMLTTQGSNYLRELERCL